MEAIILAGGLGTRLRSVVTDLPKCMAPVAGHPFLYYVIEDLINQQVDQFIFSLGYRSEQIISFLKNEYPALQYQVSLEDEPLGTGGAIKLSLSKTSEQDVLILNGDTLFKVDLKRLLQKHLDSKAECTLSLKPMQNFDRYGVVELDKVGTVTNFKEKHFYKNGLINGGVYLINKQAFLQQDLPTKFSFEKDYLEKNLSSRKIFGIEQDEYFIDIGIPEDYHRAQIELVT